MLRAEVEVGGAIRAKVRISDEDDAADRNAVGRRRNDELGELRRLKRRADRGAHRGISGRRPDEAGAWIETRAERAEIAVVERERIVNVARRIGLVAQDAGALRLRKRDHLRRAAFAPAPTGLACATT